MTLINLNCAPITYRYYLLCDHTCAALCCTCCRAMNPKTIPNSSQTVATVTVVKSRVSELDMRDQQTMGMSSCCCH